MMIMMKQTNQVTIPNILDESSNSFNFNLFFIVNTCAIFSNGYSLPTSPGITKRARVGLKNPNNFPRPTVEKIYMHKLQKKFTFGFFVEKM